LGRGRAALVLLEDYDERGERSTSYDRYGEGRRDPTGALPLRDLLRVGPLALAHGPRMRRAESEDANGILNVIAKDRATGKQQSMTFTGRSGLPPKELDRMVGVARAHTE
jgi:molecular chaperone DnaK (HSP70)